MGDGAWGRHGDHSIHRPGTGRTLWMRGDRVGVGDIGAVFGDAYRSEDTVRGGDSRDARGQHDAGMVFGSCEHQPGALDQPCWHWIVDAYSTRGKHGASDIHRQGTSRAHGMRGNRVGIGDINEMQGLSICI